MSYKRGRFCAPVFMHKNLYGDVDDAVVDRFYSKKCTIASPFKLCTHMIGFLQIKEKAYAIKC